VTAVAIETGDAAVNTEEPFSGHRGSLDGRAAIARAGYPPEVVSRTRSLAGSGHTSGVVRRRDATNSRWLMHDRKLQSISVDWKAGTATFSLTWSDKPAALAAHGARPSHSAKVRLGTERVHQRVARSQPH
jgi:hypothetical protein